MAPITLRKAIGAVKDQTSIGIAKVASNMAPELEVAIVKDTSHDDDPAGKKYIRKILKLTSQSRGYVSACVDFISKRLSKTRDWIVALKCLVLIHRLLNDGDSIFQQEIMYATRRGTRLLNMADFRDEAHSNSWDHSTFVRTYGFYLDQRLDLITYERKQTTGNNDSGDVREGSEKKDATPLREMKLKRIFGKMGHLQRLLDRVLSCRPTGLARNSRMVLVALYPIIQESFKIYSDISEILAVLLDKIFDMEQQDYAKAFDVCVSAPKQLSELFNFYKWCIDMGIGRSSVYREVQKFTGKVEETLKKLVQDRSKAEKTPEKPPEVIKEVKEVEPVPEMKEIKALPAPKVAAAPPPEVAEPSPKVEHTGDLVDLRGDSLCGNDQGNKFALALFAASADNVRGAFGSSATEVTSVWQNLAADPGKADWELALVETASNLQKQKADMGGGLDPLLLNGMYNQGTATRHVNSAVTSGSASSAALHVKSTTPVLALPAPDGSVYAVGRDPFATSLSVPPPSYVQMADIEKKQQLLVQEQIVWNQYARDGMQGQVSLGKISNGGYVAPGQPPMMSYGAPAVNGSGYYYPTY